MTASRSCAGGAYGIEFLGGCDARDGKKEFDFGTFCHCGDMRIPAPFTVKHEGWLSALAILLGILFFIVPLTNKVWVTFVKGIPILGDFWIAIMALTPKGQVISITWVFFLLLLTHLITRWFPEWPGKHDVQKGLPENYQFDSTDFDLSSTKSKIGLFLYCWPGKLAVFFSLFLLCGVLSGVIFNGGKHV